MGEKIVKRAGFAVALGLALLIARPAAALDFEDLGRWLRIAASVWGISTEAATETTPAEPPPPEDEEPPIVLFGGGCVDPNGYKIPCGS